MSRVSGNVGRRPAAFAGAANATDWAGAIRVGLVGGLVGGVTIWVYEAVVWVGAQHLMPLAGIPRNATGLVFGKAVQEQLGPLAYLLGTAIHLVFSLGWGVLFAIIWPFFRRRGVEATLVALFYAMGGLDRDACPDRDRLLEPPGLPRSERDHRRVHVALLLRGARGPDRQAGARAICTMTGRSRSNGSI